MASSNYAHEESTEQREPQYFFRATKAGTLILVVSFFLSGEGLYRCGYDSGYKNGAHDLSEEIMRSVREERLVSRDPENKPLEQW